MNELELVEVVGKVRDLWAPDDLDAWSAVLAGVGYGDACAALNTLARTGSWPTVVDLEGVLPETHRMTPDEQAAGLAHVEALRALMRPHERNTP